MNRKLIVMLVAAGAAFAATAALEGRFLHELSGEIVSPHFSFRAPAPGKPLKALFLLDRRGARDAVEVAQRFALEPTYFLMTGRAGIAAEDMYESSWKGTTVYEKTRELDRKLLAKYDVYVFGHKEFTSVNDEHRYRILKAVRDEGAGLLIVSDFGVKRMPYRKVYAEPLPEPAFAKAFAREFKRTSLDSWRLGKGIVAELSWRGNFAATHCALAPVFPIDDEWTAKYENAMAFVGAAMRYAAGLESVPSEPLVVRYRDRFNREEKEPAFAGRHFRDTIGANGAVKVEEVAVASPFEGIVLESPETVKPGERIRVAAKWKSAATAAFARLETIDSPYARTFVRMEKPLAPRAEAVDFEVADTRLPTKAGYLRLTLLDAAKRPLEIVERPVFLLRRLREDYMQMSWDTPLSMQPFVGAPIVTERVGFHYGLLHPARRGDNIRELALLNQHAVPYTTRICIGEEKNGSSMLKNWSLYGGEVNTRLKEIAGDRCYYRPEVRELWREGLRARCENLWKYSPAYYNLGDENEIAVDVGFGEFDDRYFREFLAKRYGTIDNLNRNWRASYRDFSEVPHPKPADAKKAGNLAAWADHRAYIEKMYADIHDDSRALIRELDPGAPVGAEGSMPGELELSIANQEFWGPYSNLIGDEALRSFGGDRIRMLWWGGYPSSHGGRGLHPFPVPLMQDLAKGTVMGNAWFDINTGNNHGFFYSDLRFADDVAAYMPWLDRFRNGLAQLLIRNPLKDEGTLFYWSHASQTAAKGDERCLAQTDGLSTLIRYAYRSGRSFELVSSRTLERLTKAKAVFLCGCTALSDAEIAALLAFAAKGGRLVADVKPAVYNEFLCPRAADPFAGAKNYTLLDRKLSVWLGREKSPGEFDREIGRCFPERVTCQTSRPMPANAILRTRRGPGFDLVTAMWPVENPGEKRVIELPRRAYVYSAMDGFIACADRLELDFTKHPFECYTLFAEKQSAPVFSVAVAKLGGEVKAALPRPEPGREMNLTLVDAAGRTRWSIVYDREENMPRELFLAYEDTPGEWKATLTDVATGLRTEHSFSVSE